MLKKISLSLVLISTIVCASEQKWECDETFYKKLRYQWNYRFSNVFINNNTYNKKVKEIKWWFQEKYDLDGIKKMPVFDYAGELVKNDYILPAKGKIKTLQSKERYHINYKPAKSTNSDILIQYKTYYTKYEDGQRTGDILSHVTCVNYKVTWCGDGTRDEEYEECDPGDANHTGWGNKGCSVECKALNGPKCDVVFYNTLRKGYKYSFHDTFRNTGKIPVKIKKTNWTFNEQYDLNQPDSNPKFIWTQNIKDRKFILQPEEEEKIIKSDTSYAIKYNPPKRSYENLQITYDVGFVGFLNDNETGYYIHTECVNYEVSWCGDGKKDDYVDSVLGVHIYEECDPADSNKEGWSLNGCSQDCKAIK